MSDMTYDKAMNELEEIVSKLEGEEISVEQALKEYENGIKLIEFCDKYLSGKEELFSSLNRAEDGGEK